MLSVIYSNSHRALTSIGLHHLHSLCDILEGSIPSCQPARDSLELASTQLVHYREEVSEAFIAPHLSGSDSWSSGS
jgi:hypothetical protein